MIQISKGLNILLILIALVMIYFFSQDFLPASLNMPLIITLIILGVFSIISIIKKEHPED
ncbi:hypothetical protein [Jeotgalicoccus meleagridis]|uniref:Uncharacterized protein n=1 Tax=Jeotgalicoccus meleagridis TaxID=2759181 RepID=A0A6V7RCF1_9STAP|nr:hypothetical protein [Jeotgalicoccus meleagridis]CAD2075411.1 hypothetical protein JEODO184_00849 [Jeotgalicoccus meleagridis]HIW38690.1 hypothetical protein [Candidatus Jeotgalicoccus stercoravium]